VQVAAYLAVLTVLVVAARLVNAPAPGVAQRRSA
jgi:hypothetical protein